MTVVGIVRRHPRVSLAIALVGAGILAFGLYWFQPQKLFIDDRVDEAIPGAAPAAAGEAEPTEPMEEAAAPPAPTGPETLAAGPVRPVNHGPASGRAVELRTPDGKLFLRLQDLEVDNGPDLRVYLSSVPLDRAVAEEESVLEDFVDLGGLKGNVGSSNYRIAGDVDLDRYRTAVVWCRRFSVAFAVASLQPESGS